MAERSTNEAFQRETNLRQLELTITRKLDGFLHGDNQTSRYGPGSERGEGRAYQPGDDARRIDWSVSARMNELHVRDTLADRELETWLVVDGSASLDFGTSKWEKRDLALTIAAAFGLLGARGGDRTGALIYGGRSEGTSAERAGDEIFPPRAGTKAVMELLRRLDQRPRSQDAPRSKSVGSGPGDDASLARALREVRGVARRRGRLVVISDLLDDSDWESELRFLATRHDVIVAQISDPRESELPATGLLTLIDPETGKLLEIQTSNKQVRERFAAAARERREAIDKAVVRTGARHVALSTDRDWMRDLVNFVERSRKAGVR